MILFQIKKAFFDMWDNMLSILLLNFGYVLIVGGGLYLPSLLSFNTVASLLGLAVAVFAINIYSGAVSMVTRDISDYKRPTFREFFSYFGETWKQAVVLSFIMVFQVIILRVGMPFYFQVLHLGSTSGNLGRSMVGVAGMSIIFFESVVWWVASQYFYPIRARLDTSVKKIIKKSFIIYFDNTIYSFFLAIGTLAVFIISGFTAFLLPGLASIALWHQVGFKLRLLKYDYLEENPEADRKKIPWEALLLDEKDRVGPRTLRGMIFPWKE